MNELNNGKETHMKNLKKLVLLHSNDIHGDFIAEYIDDSFIGGITMLSGYISKVRAEEPNTLYCIAGDMFMGSIIDSEYKGLSTIEIMNALSPDIVTVGNHEFDYGVAHLLFVEKCAKFPIINANLYIKTNQARLFEPCKIIEIDGMKILFIGVITEEILAQTKHEKLVGSLIDCADAADEVGRICNSYNALDIDFTVLLTHIGFEEDKKLASMLDPSWGVDVIIGGHSHTLLKEPADVNGIKIVQAGTGTDNIGRFDIMVDTDNNCIDSFEWKTVPINLETCEIDPVISNLISGYQGKINRKYQRIVTHLPRQLTHPARNTETELGNITADALKRSLGLDIMFVGSGSLRKAALGPVVTYQDFKEMYAYDDAIHMVTLYGKQIKQMIRYICRDETWEGEHTEFYQLSEGFHIVYSRKLHDFVDFLFNDAPLDEEGIYTCGFQTYHFMNMEKFFGISIAEAECLGKNKVVSSSINQVLEEYFTSHQNMKYGKLDRIVIED